MVTASGYLTTTDSVGRYTLAVPPGIHVVTVDASGYKGSSQIVDARTGETYTVNFTLAVPKGPSEEKILEASKYSFPVNEVIGAAILSVLSSPFRYGFFLKRRKKS